jgi:GntR family transcriptional regulator of arabinose operon
MIKAYQDNNIPTTKSNVIMYQSREDYEDIIKKVDMMLNSNNDITAIACYNDRLATRVISHLQKQGKTSAD